MSSPHLDLYLIHLTSPKPTMVPHRQKNIWGWFVPHAHTDVCIDTSEVSHALVSTIFMLNAVHNPLTWIYNQKIVGDLQLVKRGAGSLLPENGFIMLIL